MPGLRCQAWTPSHGGLKSSQTAVAPPPPPPHQLLYCTIGGSILSNQFICSCGSLGPQLSKTTDALSTQQRAYVISSTLKASQRGRILSPSTSLASLYFATRCMCRGLSSSSLVNTKDWPEPVLLEEGKILWSLLGQLLQRFPTPETRDMVFYLGQGKAPNGGGGLWQCTGLDVKRVETVCPFLSVCAFHVLRRDKNGSPVKC